MQIAQDPARGVRVQGLGTCLAVAADGSEITALTPSLQGRIAVRRLVERFHISPATAAAVAEANAWGVR